MDLAWNRNAEFTVPLIRKATLQLSRKLPEHRLCSFWDLAFNHCYSPRMNVVQELAAGGLVGAHLQLLALPLLPFLSRTLRKSRVMSLLRFSAGRTFVALG